MKSQRRTAVTVALIASIACTGGAATFAGEYRQADVQAAIKELASPDEDVRKSAAYKLSDMGNAAVIAVPNLIDVVDHDRILTVRGEAAHALGNIGPAAGDAAACALVDFLEEPEGYDRAYAATALGQVRKEPAKSVPALARAVDHDSEPVVRQLAARALGDFGNQGSEALPVIIEAIQKGDKDLRNAAADGLARIPAESRHIKLLLPLLSDEIDIVREAAAKSIGCAGSEAVAAVPDLTRLLTDENDKIKAAAAIALGKIGPDATSAVPDLKKALKDQSIYGEAEQALKLITKPATKHAPSAN